MVVGYVLGASSGRVLSALVPALVAVFVLLVAVALLLGAEAVPEGLLVMGLLLKPKPVPWEGGAPKTLFAPVVLLEPKPIPGEPKPIPGEPNPIPGEPKPIPGVSKMLFAPVVLPELKLVLGGRGAPKRVFVPAVLPEPKAFSRERISSNVDFDAPSDRELN